MNVKLKIIAMMSNSIALILQGFIFSLVVVGLPVYFYMKIRRENRSKFLLYVTSGGKKHYLGYAIKRGRCIQYVYQPSIRRAYRYDRRQLVVLSKMHSQAWVHNVDSKDDFPLQDSEELWRSQGKSRKRRRKG